MQTNGFATSSVMLAAIGPPPLCLSDDDNLQRAPEHLRANRDVVLAAVTKNGCALRYAAEALLADREVVLAAVQQDERALWFAAPALRADPVLLAFAGVRLGETAEQWLAGG